MEKAYVCDLGRTLEQGLYARKRHIVPVLMSDAEGREVTDIWWRLLSTAILETQ